MRTMRRFAVLLFAVLLPFSAQAARQALVIGNDTYTHITPLKNARADARAMAKSLEGAGFKVTLKTDLTEKQMTRALRDFKSGIAGGDEAVFFYAGHGVQLGGANYLLPTDLNGEDEAQVRDDAVSLQRVLDDLQEQKAKFTLAIIDACRDNPFKGQGRNIGTRGLAPTSAADGQMVIFSAGAGQQALDRVGPSDKNPNGLFTRIFIKEMDKPGVPVHDALRNVRDEVVRQAKGVNHAQTPAIYDQSTGKFFFKRGTQIATAATSSVDDTPAPALPSAESELWSAVLAGNTEDDYQTYLSQYPNGKNAGEAKRRLDNSRKTAQAAAAQKEKDAWANAEKLASAEGFKGYLDAYPQGIYSALAQTRLKRLEAAGGSSVAPGKTFKDCADCPEMVGIPAGSFEMGGTASDEQPVHHVSLKAFSLGKTEVTQAQWRAVMGTNPSRFKNCDDCPVENVSWDDIQGFLQKLNSKTGKSYRLPSEAEWEYACRAGGTHEYCGSHSVDAVAWYDKNSGSKTHPVGQKQANAFGLYDMSGNVWEWAQDCWNGRYSGAPIDGSAWATGDCGQRVQRGGSWYSLADVTRSAIRSRGNSGLRYYDSGFRVALSPARTN